MGYIGKNNFPLPTLSTTLKGLAHELYSGRGFFVLRTIPIDSYSQEDLAIVYAGNTSPATHNLPFMDTLFQVCLRTSVLHADDKMTVALSLPTSKT
jgi:hypothetical protein